MREAAMESIIKYPRTHHLEGSRLQPGDEGMGDFPFSQLRNCHLVVEEKMDGANSGISFSADKQLKLQSRGHFLTGGYRERHFNLLKQWAWCHASALWDILQDRYIMYGEWMYAKHTVFYDTLPHYFLEFDLYDKTTQTFLSTRARRALLKDSPVVSVAVLHEGPLRQLDDLSKLLGLSLFKSKGWKTNLNELSESLELDPARVRMQTDRSSEMEGLYVKWEDENRVLGRYKFVRASFMQAIADSDGHWHSRPIVPNQLREGVDLFSTQAQQSA